MTEQKTVLIIDDDEMNRMVAKMVLEKSVGCRVIAAPGGFDGITVMSMEPVDLVLLDLEMPELDGFQTLDIVQKRPDLAAIPVILLTASSDRDTVVRGSTYGIRDYIKKPFLPDDLARRVKKLRLN